MIETISYMDFLLEAKKISDELDEKQYKAIAQMSLDKNDYYSVIPLKSLSAYTKFLNDTIDEFKLVEITPQYLSAFNERYNLFKESYVEFGKYSDLMIEDVIQDTFVIKPAYIQHIIRLFNTIVIGSITGEFNSSILKQYKLPDINGLDRKAQGKYLYKWVKAIAPALLINSEKQIVRGADDYGKNVSNLKNKDNPLVKVNNDYIEDKLIPFMNGFINDRKMVLKESYDTYHAVSSAVIDIQSIFNEAGNLLNDRHVEYVPEITAATFKLQRTIFDILNYVTYKELYKLSTYINPSVKCTAVLNELNNILASLSSTTEGTFNYTTMPTDTESLTEDFLNGLTGAFSSLSNNIYNLHNQNDRIDIDCTTSEPNDRDDADGDDYDKSVYDSTVKLFLAISNGLDIISKEGGDYLLIVDDVIKDSGLGGDIEERFHNDITTIKDISKYQTSVDLLSARDNTDYITYKRVLLEVKNFGNNIDRISQTATDVYNKIDYLAKRYADNINGEYTNIEAINELKVFLNEFREQFRTLTSDVCVAFFDRLKSLGELLSAMEESNEERLDSYRSLFTIDTDTTETLESAPDFIKIAYQSMMECSDDILNKNIREAQLLYYEARINNTTGYEVVYEEGNDSTSTSTSEGPNSASDTTKNSNNANNGKMTVTDGSGNSASTIVTRIKDFITKIINTFKDFINGAIAKKRLEFINLHGNDIISRKYDDNVVINNKIAYETIKTDAAEKDITTLISNLNTLAGQNQQNNGNDDTAAKQDFYNKLFNFMTNNKIVPDGFKQNNQTLSVSQQIQLHYKGADSNYNLKQETIKGKDIQNLVQEMVNYVKDYYSPDGFGDRIAKALNNLQDIAAKAINTHSNDKRFTDMLPGAIMAFVGGFENAFRDRANDYYYILFRLVPNGKNNNNNNSNNDQNNNNNNSNNNSQSQSNGENKKKGKIFYQR